jgi:hypothetical protein
LGIQRRHDQTRSDEIRRFIQHGYPWSELSETKRKSGDYDDLLRASLKIHLRPPVS